MDVEIRDVPEVPTICSRVRCEPSEIGPTLARLLPSLGQPMRELGAKPAGPPYCRYLMGENGLELEGGVALAEPVEPEPPFAAATLGGRCAFTLHVGPYAGLFQTYRALERWLAENGHESAGAPWDLYVDDPGEVEPEVLRTEVYQPIR